jgi:NADH-quinone oxidoreductase subunit M
MLGVDLTLGGYVLPLILGVPLLGAIFVMCTPRTEVPLHRGLGLTFTFVTFFLSLLILRYYNPKEGDFQLLYDVEWIPVLGAHFKTGVDGISVFLVLLTTFLMPLTLLCTGKAIERNVREFIAAMLVLETGMLGAFVALDLFLFYVFWEVMLIPMYLLIGIWGGQRRLYAAIKFVIYTMVGSLVMLVAIFYVYVQAGSVLGGYTTDLVAVLRVALPYNAQVWCFAAFALAFAIKVPLFPLHTWLPDAHVEAPTAGSVILAGVLLKFGIYGYLRFAMPMFPHGAVVWGPPIALLALIGIIYGACVAFVQDDVKKLVAYSSVSHLGFCALGVFVVTSYGISGSIYAMLSHGLTTGGLFLGIGVLYERRHTRRLAEYGGLWKQMPVFAGLFLVVVMGSAGLPALSGFIGEFLTILGTFISGDSFPQGYSLPMPRLLGALAATGVVLGAIYLLWMFQKVFFGKLDKARNGRLPDLAPRELVTFVALAISIFLLGLFPRPLLAVMEPSVNKFMRDFGKRVAECDGPSHLFGVVTDCERLQQPRTAAKGGTGAPAPGTPAAGNTGAAGGQAGTPAGAANPGGAAPPAAGGAAPVGGTVAPAGTPPAPTGNPAVPAPAGAPPAPAGTPPAPAGNPAAPGGNPAAPGGVAPPAGPRGGAGGTAGTPGAAPGSAAGRPTP